MPSPTEIHRIATAMNALRPDWKPSSLVTFLTNHHADRPYRDLAIAAVVVASDPRTETPKLLNEHGPWWVAAYTAQPGRLPTTVPGATTPRCTVPGHEHELPVPNCRICAVEAYEPTPTPTLSISPEQAELNARGAELVRLALAGRATVPPPLDVGAAPPAPDARALAAGERQEDPR